MAHCAEVSKHLGDFEAQPRTKSFHFQNQWPNNMAAASRKTYSKTVSPLLSLMYPLLVLPALKACTNHRKTVKVDNANPFVCTEHFGLPRKLH